MSLTLYRNKSLSIKVDKVLDNSLTINGVRLVDDQFNEEEPKITVQGVTSFDNYNYFMFDDKYYFIEGVTWETDTVAIVSGRIDLLMTYKDFIKTLPCYIKRSQSNPNLYMNDNRPLSCQQIQEKLDFPYLFDDTEDKGCFILTTSQNGYAAV